MLAYFWPIGLAVLSNVFYHICAKSAPERMDPFASLTITYGVGAVVSLLLYYVLSRGGNILHEYREANWSPFVLGLAIVGLEVGFLYAYRAGWQISVAQLVQSAALAVLLIFVGRLLYHETVTWNKLAGILVCLAGLWLINMK